MWIKTVKKKNSPKGKTFFQYQLTQSSRVDGKVKHISVLYLGHHPLLDHEGNRKAMAVLLKDLILGQQTIDREGVPVGLLQLARTYHEKYLAKNPLKRTEEGDMRPGAVYEEVDISRAGLSDSREIGAEWMAFQTVKALELDRALASQGWTGEQVRTALISILSRAIFPASEHRTAQWLSVNSGLGEVFGLRNEDLPDRHHLYRAATMLFEKKDFLEGFLYKKTLDMFNLDDHLVIYDLTNTYFEGRKSGSRLARFGRSKEKRNDCKLVVLAAVVNKYGFIRYSDILEGNASDPSTLEAMLRQLQARSGGTGRNQTLVMDAGIATEENLGMVREMGLKYVCVARTKLKEYRAIPDEGEPVELEDKRGNRITVRAVGTDLHTDQWLHVESEMKRKKEAAMDKQASGRFEKELQGIGDGIAKKGGTKMFEKVIERVGRLKERYSTVARHYTVTVVPDADKKKAKEVKWERNEKKEQDKKGEGVYFLRTNYENLQEKEIWDIYNTVREVEATFRTLKTDLSLRPVFHKDDKHVKAHLFLGILAYQIVATVRYQLKTAGINHDWRNIVRIMNTQKICNIELPGKTKDITLRTCSRPIAQASEIYRALNINQNPTVVNKKFVVYH